MNSNNNNKTYTMSRIGGRGRGFGRGHRGSNQGGRGGYGSCQPKNGIRSDSEK